MWAPPWHRLMSSHHAVSRIPQHRGGHRQPLPRTTAHCTPSAPASSAAHRDGSLRLLRSPPALTTDRYTAPASPPRPPSLSCLAPRCNEAADSAQQPGVILGW